MKKTTTLIESRSNRSGIEVRAEGHTLRAYRNGELVATRTVSGTDRLTLGRTPEILDRSLDVQTRGDLLKALDEGVRILRDGRGLCEAA